MSELAVIEFRPFRNTDPPALAEVWRSQAGQRGLMQPMSVAVLDRFVLSKSYFDRRGLTVAVDGEHMLGFAHAGFGPNAAQTALATEDGVTCLVILRPEVEPAVGAELLARSEDYLRAGGAKTLHGGGSAPLSPFYYGLYGGSEPSGVLASDPRAQALFEGHGYAPFQRSVVLQRDLGQFRPVVDRQQMQIRRHASLQTILDPVAANWWEACMLEPLERIRLVLVPRGGGAPLASASFWNMETMVGTWGVRAVGIVGLAVGSDQKRQGYATYLLGDAFRQLHVQGVTLAEVHVSADNEPAIALFTKLGFQQVDESIHYRKA